jgi:hypothetical protein
MLAAAVAGAGVDLGEYDQRIVAWLAKYEPETVAVVCGLIERANATAPVLPPDELLTMIAALSDAAAYRVQHADADDLALVARYRNLSRSLGDDR